MDLPLVVIEYLAAYNRSDPTALIACVSDDIVFENVSNSGGSIKVVGRPAFAALAVQAASMFTSRRLNVANSVRQADRIALEVEWLGVPSVDIPGMPEGREVRLRAATFMTLKDDLIISIVDLS